MKEWQLPLISLVLRGQVPRLHHGLIWFPIQNTYGGAMSHQKSSTTFWTLSWRVKAYLLLRHCIKNQSIGVAYGALLNLFWIFEYITTGPFAGPLSADFPDVKLNEDFWPFVFWILSHKLAERCKQMYLGLVHFFSFFCLNTLWLMANQVIFDIWWVVDKACICTMKGQW